MINFFKNLLGGNQNSLEIISKEIDNSILNLLWIADGPIKNYINKENYNSNFQNMEIKISVTNEEEPSLIFTQLPIKSTDIKNITLDIGYFPTYKNLTPQQKFLYLKWLENPFSSVNLQANIGYVFLFYYGLERYLYLEKSESAFHMIFKLYKAYNNPSFKAYSFESMLFFTIFINAKHLTLKLLVESPYTSSLTLYARYLSDSFVTAKEFIDIASDVGFTNKRYIKNEYDLFEKTLEIIMYDNFDKKSVSLEKYYKSNLRKIAYPVLANISLRKVDYEIPDIFSNENFKNDIKHLLQSTHEKVKLILKEKNKQ